MNSIASPTPRWVASARSLARAIRATGQTRGAYYGILHAHATDLDHFVGHCYSPGAPELGSLESIAACLDNGITPFMAAACAVAVKHLCFDNLDDL